MNKNITPVNEKERNIDWEDVERKVSIICRKFNNIDPRYIDDLAQELRIHAFYISDDYYDLTRKAIDFWRTLQVRVYPEVPFFDLELIGGSKVDKKSTLEFNDIVIEVREELERPGQGYYDQQMIDLAKSIFEILVKESTDEVYEEEKDSDTLMYFGGRISVTWLSEQLGVNYKRVIKSMKFLEEVITGLAGMGKITLPDGFEFIINNID